MTDTSADPSAPAELVETIDVAATPAQVWAAVADLRGMSERSPQVWRSHVRGGPVQLGTRTVNINRRGPLFWPTRSTVVRFEPHRELAFRIKDNWTIWSFTLEETDGGTRVVHRREAPDGIAPISTRLVNAVLGGTEKFTGELRAGMRQTLARVQADAEGRAGVVTVSPLERRKPSLARRCNAAQVTGTRAQLAPGARECAEPAGRVAWPARCE